jgi:hypothetical protein
MRIGPSAVKFVMVDMPTLARRILLVLGLLCLAAVLIELSYRFYLFGFDALSIEKVDSVTEIGRAGILQASADPDIVYELIPNQDSWFKLARLRTNSAGLPDYDYAKAKPPNTFRIVLLGSSYSMPAGVPLESSWQQVLEDRLNGQRDGRRYEVVNFSVGGYDPRQLLAVLEHRAIAYDPDLILVDMTLNSPRIFRIDEAYHRSFVTQSRSHPFWHSFALESLSGHLQADGPSDFLPAVKASAVFKQTLSEFRSFAADHRTPLCFVILQHDSRRAEETLQLGSQLRQAASCVIDTSPAFRGERFSDLTILKIDPHPNARAQAIFAREVFAFLVAHRMLAEPR